jgi:hypothetical protein
MAKKKRELPFWARLLAGLIALVFVLLINVHFLVQETEMPVQMSTYVVNGTTTITQPTAQITDIPAKVENLFLSPSQVKLNTGTDWGLVVFFNICLIVGLWLIFKKVKF